MVNKEYFGEGKKIEFKREIPSRHEKFLKDIIAFSNSSGGKVVLGIEDNTNIVHGIGDVNPFKLADNITNMIDDACTPQIETAITFKTVEDKTVLVIEIIPGKYRPYYLKSAGKENSTYVRINGTSRLADARRIKELEMEGQRISYDSVQFIGLDFDKENASDLCRKMYQVALDSCLTEDEKAQVKVLTTEKLEDFGFLHRIGEELFPTNAYVLFTDNKMKHAKIQCALFKGTNRDVFIDKREFDGPLYEQVEEAYQFVLKHINLGAEIDGLYRRDVYELPIKAVREMIVNAVAHRSYIDDSCIQISIYEDRVEVLSPGTLYGGMDLETVKAGRSKCRNTAICDAFHYMKIIEQWGTGIPRIINQCKEYGLPEPLFEELGDGIRVTLYRKQLDLDNKKLDSNSTKLDLGDLKLDLETPKLYFEKVKTILANRNYTEKTINHILKLYIAFGSEIAFDRNKISELVDCSISNASLILKTLRECGIIEHDSTMDRGQYAFVDFAQLNEE